jgi:hypothetical protein
MRSELAFMFDKESSFTSFNCNYNNETKMSCEKIRSSSNENPTIYTSEDSYCIYAELVSSENLWFCVDSDGRVSEIIIDPGSAGYCDGETFICPPPGD